MDRVRAGTVSRQPAADVDRLVRFKRLSRAGRDLLVDPPCLALGNRAEQVAQRSSRPPGPDWRRVVATRPCRDRRRQRRTSRDLPPGRANAGGTPSSSPEVRERPPVRPPAGESRAEAERRTWREVAGGFGDVRVAWTESADRRVGGLGRRRSFRRPASSFQNERGIPAEYSRPPTCRDRWRAREARGDGTSRAPGSTFRAAAHATRRGHSSGEAGIAKVCPRNTPRETTRGGGRLRARRPARHAAPARATRRSGPRPSTPCPGARRADRRRPAGSARAASATQSGPPR
jgi:hypothetical protein